LRLDLAAEVHRGELVTDQIGDHSFDQRAGSLSPVQLLVAPGQQEADPGPKTAAVTSND
jgi:hypothetical protein